MANKTRSRIGVRLNKDAPTIQYLIFTDDCIIFAGPLKEQLQILNKFWTTIQQFQVNLLLSLTCTFKREISHILQISSIDAIDTYLRCFRIN